MKTVTTYQLAWMLEHDDPLVINVLDEKLLEVARGPRQANITLSSEQFVGEIEKLVEDDVAPVVVHCAGPDYGAGKKTARTLEEAGFRNIYYCEGGLKALKASGWRIPHHKTTV